MSRAVTLIVCLAFVVMAGEAAARNTEYFLDANQAVNSRIGKARLLDVPHYFEGQAHPKVREVLGEWQAKRSTRGLWRSDRESCRVAFLSALIALQRRVQAEGGDAVIDVRSVPKNKQNADAPQYQCNAGDVVVHSALTGTVVRLE